MVIGIALMVDLAAVISAIVFYLIGSTSIEESRKDNIGLVGFAISIAVSALSTAVAAIAQIVLWCL